MADFINKLNELYLVITQKNFTVAECVSSIDHQRFHLWLMLPSSLLIIAMSFTVQRKNLFRGILDGRPGAIFPMDILGRSNRFTYVAAWGTIAFLAADGILIGQRVVKFEGKKSYAAAGNAILSMLVYGLGYFPLFASLAMDSFFGYIVGTTYAWMLFVIHIYKEQECDLVYQARVVFVMRDLPLLLCLGYLSVCLPVRVVRTYRKRGFSLNKEIESASVLKNPQKVYKTPEAELVKKLLAPPTIPHPEPDGIKDKILASMKSVVANVLYQPQKGFRYSARILSVMCVGVLVLYKTSLEMLAIWVKMCYIIENHYDHVLDTIGREKRLNDSTEITNARTTAKFVLHGVDIVRGTVVSAVVLALVLGLVQVLHMLSSYRLNLQDLYKGNTIHIPHRDDGWKASLLVGTMKYAGYQVGYITWGFMVHTVLLLIIAFVLVVVIELLLHGYTAWLVHVIETLWPIVLVTLIVNYGQLLLAKFVFLQGSGDTLDIDNRRTLFILTFFLFFYNIFIGLFSCLFRIIKSIVLGAIFLPRLDHSVLPRRFQMMDPGFAAYVGFIHVEAVHSNPIMLTFLRLLMRQHHGLWKKTNRELKESDTEVIIQDMVFDEEKHVDVITKKVSKAKLRWQIAYTLLCNPQLRTQRKYYLDGVKELHKRLAKKYTLSHQDACVLFENMTTMNVDVEKLDLALDASNELELLSASSSPWESVKAVKSITQVLKAMRQNSVQLEGSDNCVTVTLNENLTGAVRQQGQGPSRLWSRIRKGELTKNNDDQKEIQKRKD